MAAIDKKTKRYPSDLTDEKWSHVAPLIPPVKKFVFAAFWGMLRSTETSTRVAQAAPASQFGWTYDRYQIAERIRAIAV